jgi:hypothetical protein
MKLFELRRFALVVYELRNRHAGCDEGRRKMALGGPAKPSDLELKVILEELRKAEQVCLDIGWKHATEKIGLINTHWLYEKNAADYSSLCADIRNALDVLLGASWDQKVVQIDRVFYDFVNNDVLFGEQVKKSFPDASSDIRDAGNCIATDLGTAAVFHLMRAVEWGLRALCANLGILRVRKTNKPGKRKFIPIEYSQWERMLDAVYDSVDKKIDKLGPGKKKQDLQEFYYPLLRDLKGFKDAWRNHVMHSRAEYSTKTAIDIFEHVRAFMTALASKE